MQKGISREEFEVFSGLFAEKASSSLSINHTNHPDTTTLEKYVQNALMDGALPKFASTDEFALWMAGNDGWSTSSLSLHIFSCSECSSRVNSLRFSRAEDAKQNPRSLMSWLSLGKASSFRPATAMLSFIIAVVGLVAFVHSFTPIQPTVVKNSDQVVTLTGYSIGGSIPQGSDSNRLPTTGKISF